MNIEQEQSFDVLVVGDARFSGGSTGALAADVTAFSKLGLTIGMFFVRSGYLDDSRDSVNPVAQALLDLPGVTALTDGAVATADIAFLHHPMVFYRGIEERARLSAKHTFIVTHHAPFRPDGSIEFDPMRTVRNVRAALGLRAAYAPISGMVRDQLASFAPLVAMSAEDWPNIFDPIAWPVQTRLFEGTSLTIGRHGRADMLKWAATPADIQTGLPSDDKTRVRVLGCPEKELRSVGVDTSAWDTLEFGAEPVADFLNSLDVFVYHFSPKWMETFGRTVAEAMLCGRLCLLDHRLEPTFGDKAQYCHPWDVSDVLDRLRQDPDAARQFAAEARKAAIADYGQESVQSRMQRFLNSKTTRVGTGAAYSGRHVLKKLFGHYRRRARGADG